MKEYTVNITDEALADMEGIYNYIAHNLSAPENAATGKAGVHTRQVGLDRNTNKELLLKHIRDNNETGTPFKELQQVLPSLSRDEIKVLMRELRSDNKVICVGKTSAARWFLVK